MGSPMPLQMILVQNGKSKAVDGTCRSRAICRQVNSRCSSRHEVLSYSAGNPKFHGNVDGPINQISSSNVEEELGESVARAIPFATVHEG